MNIKQKIIVAMPAFNEASYMGTMVLRTKQYADEVLVVDDGSGDDTVEIAELAGATVVKHGKNMGYGATLMTIFIEALEKDADVLVILDADTQHSPSDIPAMIKAITDGNDLVIGHRNPKQIPTYRKMGQLILSYFTSYLSGKKALDTQSGFRAYSKKALMSLQLKEMGMAISSEIVSDATKKGLKIIEVPISVKYTKDGSTLNPVAQGANTLTRIIVMISKRKPLVFFGIVGSVMTIGGLFAGIRGYQMFMEHEILPIGIILISVLFIIVGILSIFTGIILNAVKRD